MAKQSVFVEVIPETGIPVRIIRTNKEVYDLPPERVAQMARKVAVGYIRDQIVARATKNILTHCEFCDKVITSSTGHMHEVISRGDGGEISLDNSVFICAQCHLGKDGEHGDRRFQSSKKEENAEI